MNENESKKEGKFDIFEIKLTIIEFSNFSEFGNFQTITVFSDFQGFEEGISISSNFTTFDQSANSSEKNNDMKTTDKNSNIQKEISATLRYSSDFNINNE